MLLKHPIFIWAITIHAISTFCSLYQRILSSKITDKIALESINYAASFANFLRIWQIALRSKITKKDE